MKTAHFAFKVRRRLLTVAWRVRCFVSPHKVALFRLGDSAKFRYPLNSAIGYALYTAGFETASVKFVQQELRPGGVFFDVGANGGLYTLIAAQKVGPGGHVYAFEPGERELELLRQNISTNGLTNVTVIDRAVSNKCGVAEFAISRDGAMNSLARNRHPGQQIVCWKKVETTTLDGVVKEFGINNVDLVKVDVEGAEQLVLEGAQRLLSASEAPKVICEFCDVTASGFSASTVELRNGFEQLGYELFSLSGSGPLMLRPAARVDQYTSAENLVAMKQAPVE